MRLLSYLIPLPVAKFHSFWNHDIRVMEYVGNFELLVDGGRQSGKSMEKIWTFALAGLNTWYTHVKVRTILILGVGGGTVIRMVHERFPDAFITAIDIDAMMIAIGKKYFGLSEITGTRYIVADAKAYIGEMLHKHKKVDMVFVDIFNGPRVPAFVESVEFLTSLSEIITPEGVVLINYLRDYGYEKKSELLLDKLTKIFQSVHDRAIYHNRFFAASRRTTLTG